MTWLQRNWLLLHFCNFFQDTDWLHDVTKGEVFASNFDETKAQDTDSSAKNKYEKENDCKAIRWTKAYRKQSHRLWQC